ncbi:methyltransferase domain-containing protein [Catenulispora rubra]|uniref:methyltransferase domain-containing protein n=1 Tax=Catenulispora rubra TaxID=280293 RepID=UPI001892228C|nr:methyltransferase domain-containing protein [Catenulispora rubra]
MTGRSPAAAVTAGGPLRDYDDIFVPVLFHPWACLLVGALTPEPASAALDVGTGPGTVARVLAACVGPAGRVVAVDSNADMLALAENKPAVAGAPISYLEGDAGALQVPDDEFDVVTCQQILQFVTDLPAALAKIRVSVKHGGRLGALTWCALDRNPLFRVLFDTVRDQFGSEAAEAFAKPWSLSAPETARAVAAAGFTDVLARRHTLPAVFPGGPDQVCRFFGFTSVGGDLSDLDETSRHAFYKLARKRLAPMTAGDGTLYTTTTAALIVARA